LSGCLGGDSTLAFLSAYIAKEKLHALLALARRTAREPTTG